MAGDSFSKATAVQASSSHIYTAFFRDPWCIGTVPHGGYVTSTFQRVASVHFATTLNTRNQPYAIALHLEFLRRTSIGPATFHVRDVKIGRQTSTIHVKLLQENKQTGEQISMVEGYITHANFNTETGVTFPTSWKLEPAPKPADLSKFRSNDDPHWVLHAEERYQEFRRAHGRVRCMVPRHKDGDLSWADEWMSFSSFNPSEPTIPERFTNESLGFVADMFPQLIEAYLDRSSGITSERSNTGNEGGSAQSARGHYWYPTLLLNLDIKKGLPSEGVEWLFVRVRAKVIKNGRYDLEVIVLDDKSEVVCLSHHVVMAVSASRNLAGRRDATPVLGNL